MQKNNGGNPGKISVAIYRVIPVEITGPRCAGGGGFWSRLWREIPLSIPWNIAGGISDRKLERIGAPEGDLETILEEITRMLFLEKSEKTCRIIMKEPLKVFLESHELCNKIHLLLLYYFSNHFAKKRI